MVSDSFEKDELNQGTQALGTEREIYEEMATQELERDIESPDEGNGKKSLTDKQAEAPNLSDMKAAALALNPDDLGDVVTNKLMIGRIAPDAFLPLLHLLVKAEIARSDPNKPINVEKIMAKYYILLSIGLDGKGRIDILELAGAQADKDEIDKMGKGMGM